MKQKKLLTLVVALFSPAIAFAQGTPTLGGMAQAITGQILLVATWLVVIMWVVTGIAFLTSQGEASSLKTARNALFAAIGGTIIIILAQGAVAFVKNSFGI